MGVGVLDPADYGRSLCRGSNSIDARHELRLGVGGHPYTERVFQESYFFVSCRMVEDPSAGEVRLRQSIQPGKPELFPQS